MTHFRIFIILVHVSYSVDYSLIISLFPSSWIRSDNVGRSKMLPKSFFNHLKMDTARRNKTGIRGREVMTDED